MRQLKVRVRSRVERIAWIGVQGVEIWQGDEIVGGEARQDRSRLVAELVVVAGLEYGALDVLI